MPVVIAVHNHKGGVGKTTLTILLASMFAYDLDTKVLVLDGDTTQTSIFNKRQKELQEYRQALGMYDDLHLRKEIPGYLLNRIESNLAKNIGPDALFSIKTVPPEKMARIAFDKMDYDLIFIDMGAKLETEYEQIMSRVDLLLIPFGHLNFELDASTDYVLAIADAMRGGKLSSKLTVRPFWNRIKLYTNPLCNDVEGYLLPAVGGLNIEFLKSRLFSAESGFGDRKLITSYSSPLAGLDEKDKILLVNRGTTKEATKEREYIVRALGFMNEVVDLVNGINNTKAGY